MRTTVQRAIEAGDAAGPTGSEARQEALETMGETLA